MDKAKINKAFAFGHYGLMVYLAFLSAFVPLSIDLYLPALPSMTLYFGSTAKLTNLSLSLFLLFFALSMLAWGPFADKYGRKPILLLGLLIYIGASILLALCTSIYQLLLGRIFQAIGSGAVITVSMAIVKDTYQGRTMETALATIQTMSVLSPLMAPVLGGILLIMTSWRGIFWVLGGCGLLALTGFLALRETLENPTPGKALSTLKRISFVLSHKGFRRILVVFSLGCMPFMAFLATSSYIYITYFEISPQKYSYFFSANAVMSLAGPLLYLRFFRDFGLHRLILGSYLLMALAGGALSIFGYLNPYIFALLFMPITACGSGLRPPTTTLLMNQLNSDSGTVSSLVGSMALFCGALSMLICSLPWPNFILATGLISCIVSLGCALAWLKLDQNHEYSSQ